MTQIPKGPWKITPDARLPFDLRVHSDAGLAICKVYGEDAMPREQLATAIAALPAMVEALRFYAKSWTPNSDGDPGTPGLSRSWMEPNDDLLADEGGLAEATLRRAGLIPPEPQLEEDQR